MGKFIRTVILIVSLTVVIILATVWIAVHWVSGIWAQAAVSLVGFALATAWDCRIFYKRWAVIAPLLQRTPKQKKAADPEEKTTQKKPLR
ncbi:hypothetical protein IV54_GL000598 [Levilactobacillus paucivorans]|uniref:Uncharacterized protein n=1 Tax=Levilactobacillus paucivorans TaxID=616990 RepID=A0A0R2LNI3_9LACO|nr:hypothetical protein [Levilactobacillus paucivorans]KRO00275.1 hypothetical protein IV54_GL000598 [Levilactobacillus paucivorans]